MRDAAAAGGQRSLSAAGASVGWVAGCGPRPPAASPGLARPRGAGGGRAVRRSPGPIPRCELALSRLPGPAAAAAAPLPAQRRPGGTMQAQQLPYEFFSEENAPKWRGLLVPALKKPLLKGPRTLRFPYTRLAFGVDIHPMSGKAAGSQGVCPNNPTTEALPLDSDNSWKSLSFQWRSKQDTFPPSGSYGRAAVSLRF